MKSIEPSNISEISSSTTFKPNSVIYTKLLYKIKVDIQIDSGEKNETNLKLVEIMNIKQKKERNLKTHLRALRRLAI
jgi:soluble P-type ATPase